MLLSCAQENDTQIDGIMLANKEIADLREREALSAKLEQIKTNKKAIQAQIEESNRLREEAF